MLVFWTANDMRGESYDTIKENGITDWYDTDTDEYFISYDTIYKLNEDSDDYVFTKFIDFMYMIYTDFELCCDNFTYSNIEREDVEPLLKEIINKNPIMFLKMRNSVLNASRNDFTSSCSEYKSDVEVFVNDLADNYVKKYFPTEYKIFNMELKLKKS